VWWRGRRYHGHDSDPRDVLDRFGVQWQQWHRLAHAGGLAERFFGFGRADSGSSRLFDHHRR